MAINLAVLEAWVFAEIVQTYDETSSILYALGLGLGQNPLDPVQLQFVYEDGLRALPTMATTLGFPGPFLSDPVTGIDYSQVVHGEQQLTVLKPLPIAGSVRCTNRVIDVVDRGADRGAAITIAREIHGEDGQLICRQSSVLIARGDGGFGGITTGSATQPLDKLPDRAPDLRFEWRVPTQAALVYRLSGDRNPLHAVPERARQAGFERPILHGLASFGIAGFASFATLCAGNPDRLREIAVRFTNPVIPGDTLMFEFWHLDEGLAAFRARAIERDRIVLNNGRVRHG